MEPGDFHPISLTPVPACRQRTDSTHVLAAIRDLGRLECITETLRYALNAVAEEAPNWLTTLAPPEWYERYGKRIEESHLPRKPIEREELAALVGGDGFKLMDAIYSSEAPMTLRQLPAVETLRQLWLQQFYAPESTVRWRLQEDRPPCVQQIRSPYDIEARYGTKRTTHWYSLQYSKLISTWSSTLSLLGLPGFFFFGSTCSSSTVTMRANVWR